MTASDAAAPGELVSITNLGPFFAPLAAGWQVVLLIVIGILGEPSSGHFKLYQEDGNGVEVVHPFYQMENIQLYNNYIGVTCMMFIGFGYLMTFLRWYGLGAVGLTMFITALGMQTVIVFQHLCEGGFHKFPLDFWSFLHGDFGVAAILISFGGIIGKVNPTQLVVLVVFEAIFYCLNTVFLLVDALSLVDCGGSIIIHMFGAYFGLAVSWALGHKAGTPDKEAASQISDVFSLIGTTFLWLYWPSFVAGWLTAGTAEAEIALSNTVLALLGSTVCTFIVSALTRNKILSPVDIQNATLAGGVSIGALANLNIHPVGAVLVGCSAGIVSALGYWKVQGFLLDKIGLHDTCGINNLHGMPSLLGGIVSIFVPLLIDDGNGAGAKGEPWKQLVGVVGTMAVSIVSGLITGFVMKLFQMEDMEPFNDKMFWEVAEEEEPVPKGAESLQVNV